MKKYIMAVTLFAAVASSAQARSFHSGDWGAVLQGISDGIAQAQADQAAAAAAQQAAEEAAERRAAYRAIVDAYQPPSITYTGYHIDPAVGVVCHYSDGSQRPYPSLSACPGSFR